MDTFIEVVGHATYIEQITEQRVNCSITVRAAGTETAVAEAKELRDQCIRALKNAGLLANELSEGGRAIWQPWYWKKKPGQEVTHKILISCSESSRLYNALDALEPLFDNKRYTLDVSHRPPKFTADLADKAKAQTQAFTDAREKAEIIAAEASIQISKVIQIEELTPFTEHSGAYGDESWRGVAYVGAVGGMGLAEEDSGYEELDGAQRIKIVRYKIRFAIK